MRILSVKQIFSTGVILAIFLSVLLLHFRYARHVHKATYSSDVLSRQKNTIIVFQRGAKQNNEHSRQLINSNMCLNTTFQSTTKHGVMDSNAMVGKRFKDRNNSLMKACSEMKDQETYGQCDESDVKQNLKYSEKTNTVYCSIEKTGSTFWKRILFIVGGKGNVSNPTDIKPIQAEYSENRFSDMKEKDWKEIEYIFKTSKSIMFVRDPYARLFSAWLDKFYSPNVIYWNSTGRVIARSQRQMYEDKCASDITFTEFVNHTADTILSGNKCIDRHFSPNYKHCNPCKLKYDYIGKYETMKEDTLFILNALNFSKEVQFSDFDNDAAEDAIKDATDWVFFQKDKLPECGLTFHCALFRVWQRLQSRGFIGCTISFPFSSAEKTITKEHFEATLRSAHRETDPNEVKNSRKEALVEAFSAIPEDVKQKVTKAFGIDFDMFGYVRAQETEIKKKDGDADTFFSNCPLDM